MSRSEPPPLPPNRTPIGAGLLVAGLAAIGAGLLLPQLLGSFSDRERMILALIEVFCLALLAAGVVVMARRLHANQEALWQLARRDELTGVGNYRALHERLGQEVARHRRRDRDFALILLDLDGFKQVNEEHGHLAGDRLLAEIGRALDDEVREEDSVFRQGGDEFAVIAPETDVGEADEIVGRLCRRVRERGFGTDLELPVSATAGIAMFPGDGRDQQSLLRRADLDLLSAKRHHRAAS